MGLKGNNNEEKIWNFLYEKIGNKCGAAGLMGNLYAESALRPNNLQDRFETKLGQTDTSYTNGVNSGTYRNFIHDSAGYGLAQWTFWSRKKALLDYAHTQGKPIDDLEMQLTFLINEIKGYTTVWNTLCNAKTVREASNVVLFKYEQPGNQGESVQNTRNSYSQTYYDRYSGIKEEQENKTVQKLIDFLKASKFSKYIVSTGGHMISNSGSDENGKYNFGAAGDQTGKEWQLRYWYNRPWSCVLRYPDIKVGLKIAELGCEAALNDNIGYDQSDRDTYWKELQKAGFYPSKITKKCEADCSAGVIANTRAVGYLMNISKLKDLKATYTGDMKNCYKNAGFEVLTDSRYLTDTKYLLPGDILLYENHHTATNISIGSEMSKTTATVTPGQSATINTNYVRYGDVGESVKELQEMLITCGYNCGPDGADGDFGKNTLSALTQFQKDNGLNVDGVYGPKTKEVLTVTYKEAEAQYAEGGIKPYLVKITNKSLNIREEPDSKSTVVGKITDKGVYTIVEEKNKFGKLKSGAGWIMLKYTKKV